MYTGLNIMKKLGVFCVSLGVVVCLGTPVKANAMEIDEVAQTVATDIAAVVETANLEVVNTEVVTAVFDSVNDIQETANEVIDGAINIPEQDVALAKMIKAQELLQNLKANCVTRTGSMKTAHVNNMNYWVYRPTASKEEALPVIVYLHGKDGCGSNINRVLSIQGIPQYINKGLIYPNAIVIAPQCPTGMSWTALSKDVMTLINALIVEENINVNKIALTGVSLGGIGTFNIAIDNPGFFSCIVPVCGSVNAGRCGVLNNVKTRIFHGTKDYGMGFSVKTADQVINANGGDSKITWLQGEGHEIRHIYLDAEYDIINWMTLQERNAPEIDTATYFAVPVVNG